MRRPSLPWRRLGLHLGELDHRYRFAVFPYCLSLDNSHCFLTGRAIWRTSDFAIEDGYQISRRKGWTRIAKQDWSVFPLWVYVAKLGPEPAAFWVFSHLD